MAIKHIIPTITLWNRLEGRPRTSDFSRALKAEIRDPLWMLSKQWQMGEFQGEDAGSVVIAKVQVKTHKMTKYGTGENTAKPFNNEIPLEVQVENQEIPFQLGSQKITLDLRLLMGRHWLKLLKARSLTLKSEYLQNYGFILPPNNQENAHIYAHIEVWQLISAASSKCMDGYKLYTDIKNSLDLISSIDVADQLKLTEARNKFVVWFETVFFQPNEGPNPTWKAPYLEHQFECSAVKGDEEKVFVADEYYHGHLDWYNLDIHNKKAALPSIDPVETSQEKVHTLSFIPSPIAFPGMPHSRWWALEDWKTSFVGISPDTTDINQLILLDFALNYSNDWFILPFTLPIGGIANVAGVMVTNVFGEHIWVESADRGQDDDWKERWSMFKMNVRGNMDVPVDSSLFLMPAAPKILEGKPLEEVYMMRDEIANMVWGIESKIPLATGKSKSGKEAGLELSKKYQDFIQLNSSAANIDNDSKIKYQIVNTVPEQWIPFIPVHKEGDFREIQLQRASMPRIIKGDTSQPKKIEPRTSILREGLDKKPDKLAYFIHEEEIPRSGIRVHKSFQRTRWLDGKVYNWIGFRKQVGRGEGHSGLAFDQITPKE